MLTLKEILKIKTKIMFKYYRNIYRIMIINELNEGRNGSLDRLDIKSSSSNIEDILKMSIFSHVRMKVKDSMTYTIEDGNGTKFAIVEKMGNWYKITANRWWQEYSIYRENEPIVLNEKEKNELKSEANVFKYIRGLATDPKIHNWRVESLPILQSREQIVNLKTSISLPELLNDLNSNIVKLDNITNDSIITQLELDRINYKWIKYSLERAFADTTWNEQLKKSRERLIKSINRVDDMYRWNMQRWTEKYINVRELMELVSFTNMISNEETRTWKNFAEIIKEASLWKMLEYYESYKNDEWRRSIIVYNIVEKHIKSKQNHLTYDENGNIIIESDKLVNWKFQKVNDPESMKILDIILEDDLKEIVLDDVLTSSWFDASKEWADYKNIIDRLFRKHKIKKEPVGPFVFEDLNIPERKETIRSIIMRKLSNSKDISEIKELRFILDYINRPKSYKPKTIEKASEKSYLKKVWVDFSSSEWINRLIGKAKEGTLVKTLINDVMSANWGLMWAAIIIWAIIWLFKWWNWRKFSYWTFWILIWWPAAEELLNKYFPELIPSISWWFKKEHWKVDSSTSSLELPFGWVDVEIKWLPTEYESKYKEAFKRNTKDPGGVNKQDFAQIYSQLSQSKDLKKKDLKEVKQKLKWWTTPLKDIIWENNIPTSYWDKTELLSENQEIITGRTINETDVRTALLAILENEDSWDRTLWDLFVNKQEVTTDYIPWTGDTFKGQNQIIDKALSEIPFDNENREQIVKILWKTKGWTDKLLWAMKIDKKKQTKEEIGEIIKELTEIKQNDSTIAIPISEIITQYQSIEAKLDSEINFDEFVEDVKEKTDINFLWTPLISKITYNKWVDTIAAIVWFLNIDPSLIVPNKLKEISLDDINNQIKRANDMKEAWKLSEEQEKEIDELLKILVFEKMILVWVWKMNKQWVEQEDLTKQTLAELININIDLYKNELEKIEESLDEITNIPNPENLQGYSSLLLPNYSDLEVLEWLIKADNSTLSESWKQIVEKAKDLLKKLDIFSQNLEKYIQKKRDEIDNIQKVLNGKVKTEIINWVETKYNDIYKEFIDEWAVISLRNLANKYLKINNWQEKDYNNVVGWFENYLAFLWTTKDLGSEELKDKLDEIKNLIEQKRQEVDINTEVSIDITNITGLELSQIQWFIKEVEENEKVVAKIEDKDIKKERENELDLIKSSLVDKMTKALEWEDERQIETLKSNYDVLEKAVWNWGNDKFEEKYYELERKMVKKELLESLNSLKLLEIPQESQKEIKNLFMFLIKENWKNNFDYKTFFESKPVFQKIADIKNWENPNTWDILNSLLEASDEIESSEISERIKESVEIVISNIKWKKFKEAFLRVKRTMQKSWNDILDYLFSK